MRKRPTHRWEFLKEKKKKERKHTLDQETDQENDQNQKFFLFFIASWSRACFLSFYLDRYRYFFLSLFINSWTISITNLEGKNCRIGIIKVFDSFIKYAKQNTWSAQKTFLLDAKNILGARCSLNLLSSEGNFSQKGKYLILQL